MTPDKKINLNPVTTIDKYNNEEPVIIIHSHINFLGKMVLNKLEAALLLAKLYQFITDKNNENHEHSSS